MRKSDRCSKEAKKKEEEEEEKFGSEFLLQCFFKSVFVVSVLRCVAGVARICVGTNVISSVKQKHQKQKQKQKQRSECDVM